MMTSKQASIGHQSLLRPVHSTRRCFVGSFRGHGIARHASDPNRYRGSANKLVVQAQQNFATQLIGGAFGGANEIFVAGESSYDTALL